MSVKDLRNLAGAEGPGLWRLPLPSPTLPPATTTNHYLVGDDRAVLVDPATPGNQAQAALQQWVAQARAGKIQLVAQLLTHHHRDHIGAAEFVRTTLQLPIWAHRSTAELLADRLQVDQWIDDGAVVATNRDGSPWRALHTPGHAPGHLAIWHAASRQAVVGDLVAGQGTILIDPSDGHMGLYLASLQRMADLQPRTLAPAHGPVQHQAVELLQHYRRHRLAREAGILRALSATPQQPADLLPAAYADVPRTTWPLALRSLTTHLLHLQEQGLAEATATGWRRL
ncbi:MAG: MBL fold metallo-hydrolase [Deltaproteobacteria bacterium]|nr:MBL fold metallo-hydrolase [Deltaproteobacteria bacterium]